MKWDRIPTIAWDRRLAGSVKQTVIDRWTTTNTMTDSKTQKKAAKTQAKLEKKRLKQDPAAPDPRREGESPAERAARAAERQVRLQRWRVIIAALTLIGTVLTVWATM